MYDMDPRDPWDSHDYIRFCISLIGGIAIVIVLIYIIVTNMPEAMPLNQCCQYCCP